MKVHINKARRVPGFHVGVEYSWSGEKAYLANIGALDRIGVYDMVKNMTGEVREAKAKVQLLRVGQVKTGEKK